MADLVMVGAGPQALTLSCLLLQKRPRLQRRLRILDPSGHWLSRWQRQMERYDIPWLRSRSPHHPDPNAHALRRFAHRQPSEGNEGLNDRINRHGWRGRLLLKQHLGRQLRQAGSALAAERQILKQLAAALTSSGRRARRQPTALIRTSWPDQI